MPVDAVGASSSPLSDADTIADFSTALYSGQDDSKNSEKRLVLFGMHSFLLAKKRSFSFFIGQLSKFNALFSAWPLLC